MYAVGEKKERIEKSASLSLTDFLINGNDERNVGGEKKGNSFYTLKWYRIKTGSELTTEKAE